MQRVQERSEGRRQRRQRVLERMLEGIGSSHQLHRGQEWERTCLNRQHRRRARMCGCTWSVKSRCRRRLRACLASSRGIRVRESTAGFVGLVRLVICDVYTSPLPYTVVRTLDGFARYPWRFPPVCCWLHEIHKWNQKSSVLFLDIFFCTYENLGRDDFF